MEPATTVYHTHTTAPLPQQHKSSVEPSTIRKFVPPRRVAPDPGLSGATTIEAKLLAVDDFEAYNVRYRRRSKRKFKTYRNLSGNPCPEATATASPRVKALPATTASGSQRLMGPVHATATCPAGAYMLALRGMRPSSIAWIDAFLNQHLRPHQREGVEWMYCQLLQGGGCILADAMGLGKTLQAIVLIWVAIRTFTSAPALISKCIVVCPSSVVGIWEQGKSEYFQRHPVGTQRNRGCCRKYYSPEVKKWLGGRLKFLIARGDAKESRDIFRTFSHSTVCKLLIVSYDLLRRLTKSTYCKVDMLICDEGHRLKSLKSQTVRQLREGGFKYRIILSGTPLQNNMDELYACCSLVRPDRMPPPRVFNHVFKKPILQACRPGATLREKHVVPPKKTVAVYIPLTAAQQHAYKALCARLLSKGQLESAYAFAALWALRRLVNDPESFSSGVTRDDVTEADGHNSSLANTQLSAHESDFVELLKPHLRDSTLSPKMVFLRRLLSVINRVSTDRVVVVSNFTSILDRVEQCLKIDNHLFLRLDGSTPAKLRTEIVNAFNLKKTHFVFLLSSKAGGIGLNLTGANRLVLLDPDWNPANDQQALARVWREGQRKPVFIYRLLGANTLEEVIFERQEHKVNLAEKLVDRQIRPGLPISDKDIRKLFVCRYDNTRNSSTAILPSLQIREESQRQIIPTSKAFEKLPARRQTAVSPGLAEQKKAETDLEGETTAAKRQSGDLTSKCTPPEDANCEEADCSEGLQNPRRLGAPANKGAAACREEPPVESFCCSEGEPKWQGTTDSLDEKCAGLKRTSLHNNIQLFLIPEETCGIFAGFLLEHLKDLFSSLRLLEDTTRHAEESSVTDASNSLTDLE